jgi:hypothetical protein
MLRLILATVLLILAIPAGAVTKYVRIDGGTATQCTGLADAAYPGSGTAQACAWNHPSWALGMATPGGAARRIAGGDTLIIGDGSYDMGLGGGGDDAACSDPFECYVRPLPSGTSGAPTRILGANHATGCKTKPELWGRASVGTVLDLTASDWVEIRCLEITDHAACITNHPTIPCPASSGNWGRVGIYAEDSDNVILYDVSIHGLGTHGINAGRLSNWLLERVQINANGWAGWDGNINQASGSNSGYMNFKRVEIAWNGCTENYPSPLIIGCWGQSSGGYGDGIGTVATLGNWLFEDGWIHHNSSDGLDMLYLDLTGTINVRRMRTYGNAGQQIKARGIVTIESSYIVGNCSYFFGRFGTHMPSGDSCRASGNSIALNVPNITGVAATIRYNTITGQGDVQILATADSGTTSPNAIINIENNVIVGFPDWLAGDQTVLYFGFNAAPIVNYRNNSIFNVKNGTCPATSTCTTPLLKNMTLATFDGRPTSASYLRNSGNTAYPTPAFDVDGRVRPLETTPTRGAFEYVPIP